MLPAPEKTLSGSSRPSCSSPAATWRSAGSRCGSPTGSRRRSGRAASSTATRCSPGPCSGERLRPIPSGSYRGYPLELIEPTCGGEEAGATVTVTYGGESVEIPVDDETQVVGRWSKERCAERAIERIARAGVVAGHRIEGSGADAVALFRLTATPDRAARGPSPSTPSAAPRCTRRPTATSGPSARRSRGTGPDVTVELPAQPARCDVHALRLGDRRDDVLRQRDDRRRAGRRSGSR